MLAVMAGIYMSQEDYEHAEPYLLQATDIEEKLYNYDPRYGGMETRMLMTLCMLYEKWGKPEKLEPYDRKLISLLEKEPGPDTTYLEQTLTREGKTLAHSRAPRGSRQDRAALEVAATIRGKQPQLGQAHCQPPRVRVSQ